MSKRKKDHLFGFHKLKSPPHKQQTLCGRKAFFPFTKFEKNNNPCIVCLDMLESFGGYESYWSELISKGVMKHA